VRRCYNYLANRPGQFHHQAAIAAKLPIGSGEVESAHRYVIQKRFKLPGAWWTINNAQAMLKLRVLRENNRWNDYGLRSGHHREILGGRKISRVAFHSHSIVPGGFPVTS